MAEDERTREANINPADEGPGCIYQPFLVMEELLDKLKLLHYETTFCTKLGFKPFSRHYFALSTNSGEQFMSFVSIAAWLIQQTGKHFDQPQEYDDPNATISSILEEMRQMGHKPDFPPNKLKTGSGMQCIWVLDRLADEALKNQNFSWKRPVYPEEEAEEENVMEDNAEIDVNTQEDDLVETDEEVEEETVLGLDDLQRRGGKQDLVQGSKPELIMESNTDAAEWRLEVERVTPQLKVVVRADNKDWRIHVDQMHQHEDSIGASLKDTKTQLDKLQDEITRTLEKIASREKYINNQLERHLTEFRTVQDQLAETKEQYRQASTGVTERTRTLAEVTDELDRIKQDMEDRGTSMTDGAPVVRIKQALTKLRQECTQMDIRTGVLQHVLLRVKLKEKIHENALTLDDTMFNGY